MLYTKRIAYWETKIVFVTKKDYINGGSAAPSMANSMVTIVEFLSGTGEMQRIFAFK